MGSSDQYKRRAAECVRLAEKADNADKKAMLLQMAQTWLRLAERAEDQTDDR
jgi:putative IMPACT (imprinted ancient) family translation regulator